MWSVLGQQRDPYPVNVYPDYAHDLWQNLHQNGNGCDYISENIIRQAKVRRGSLSFGPRSYRTVILMEVESMAPETALMLEKFVASGGKVLCIGKTPYQSIGFNDYKARSAKVKETVERIRSRYPDRFLTTASPEGSLTEWYRGVQQEFGITLYVKMDNPVKWVFCNYYKSGDRDIFFITNFNRLEGHSFNAVFPESVSGKNAWIWIPETGMRYRLPQDGNRMKVDLGPSESRFIVFDSEDGGQMYSPMPCRPENAFTLSGPWDVKAEHVDGSSREFSMDRLVDFNTLPFPWLRTFAGTVSYTKTVDVTDPEAFSVLDAGKVRGITELYVNGVKAGVCWYGDHRFDIGGLLKAGANTLTLKVVTPLGNYADSLVENLTAKRYAHTMKSLGLEEEVKLY